MTSLNSDASNKDSSNASRILLHRPHPPSSRVGRHGRGRDRIPRCSALGRGAKAPPVDRSARPAGGPESAGDSRRGRHPGAGDEGFDNCATFTSTAKVMRKGVLPFAIMGMLIAVLISTPSPPASASKGCANYAMPLNRAESFWREARTDQVQACIRRFGAAPSGMTGIVTPLHLAAWFSGRPAVIAALLQGGATTRAGRCGCLQSSAPAHIRCE